jgi:ribonuclease J
VIPLGGLGEVGLNALALEAEGDLVLIDGGLLFPPPDCPGIDYLIPDFAFLRERREKLRAVLLTHGHEDHVGALGHLLADLPVPVYGTPMALGLLEARLAEAAPATRKHLLPVAPGDEVQAGAFRARFLQVTHSVPGACALALETPGGRIVHTGDFTFDRSPLDGRRTDEGALAAWGERGVDLLCCDSTNALVPGETPSEKRVGDALRRLLPRVAGRAYVSLFATNVHRIQQVVEVSRECGRQVAFLGRSVVRCARLARHLGHLRLAPGDVAPELRLSSMPRAALTVVLGGSQAEPGSALWRVARGLEPRHRLWPEDAVFLCARRIPGNEVPIRRLVDRCLQQGVQVHDAESAAVHVSGHPARGDLERMLRLVRPRHLLPVHGEMRHRDALARLATDLGLAAERVFRGGNGQTLLLEGGQVRPGPRVPTGRVVVEGETVVAEGAALLADRRRLGASGVAVVVIGGEGSRPDVTVVLRGVVSGDRSEPAAREAEAEVRRHLERTDRNDGRPWGAEEAEALARRAVHRHFRRLGGRHPLVVVVANPKG